MSVKIKRIYEDYDPADGYRVLVDRLWPRGVSKENAKLDQWFKDAAPSTELRQWFDHRPDRFAEFTVRYELELKSNPAAEELARIIKREKAVTLLYAAKDPKINHAVVLQSYLTGKTR